MSDVADLLAVAFFEKLRKNNSILWIFVEKCLATRRQAFSVDGAVMSPSTVRFCIFVFASLPLGIRKRRLARAVRRTDFSGTVAFPILR